MNTKQLNYIVSIAKHGNLSDAASELGVSQPALSKYLSELEKELGLELFLRHKKRFYPTPAGSIYLEAAEKIIAVKEQTYQTIQERISGFSQTITVGVSPLRGAIAMAKIITEFHKKFPFVKIEMHEGYTHQLRQLVLDHSIDIALGTCIDTEEANFRHISCHEEEPVLFVPSFHPLAKLAVKSYDRTKLSRINIKEFKDSPFLISAKGQTLRFLSDTLFEQNHMHPTIAFETPNNLIIKHLAEHGAGVALLVDSHIEPSDNLVYFHLDQSYPLHMTMMTAKDKILSEAERYLIALNFFMERENPNYRYNPNSAALEILKEFQGS